MIISTWILSVQNIPDWVLRSIHSCCGKPLIVRLCHSSDVHSISTCLRSANLLSSVALISVKVDAFHCDPYSVTEIINRLLIVDHCHLPPYSIMHFHTALLEHYV